MKLEDLNIENLGNRRYRVMETFSVQTNIKPEKDIIRTFSSLLTSGLMTLEKGYCSNGTDWSVDTELNMLAGQLHDFGCELRELDLLTKEQILQVDDLFEEYLEKAIDESDHSAVYKTLAKARATYMVAAVRANTKIKFDV